MADADLDILVRAKGALQAARDIGRVDTAVGKLGRTAARGARTAATNVAKVAVVAGAGIAVAAHAGIESLADLEDATTSVDGAIRNAGLAGKIAAGDIATAANEIEASVDAAFDDKDITRATATLIRFGKVTPQNIRPAMEVMTDLAVRTGSVDSAATLLGKALADPEKAAGKLARQGVTLTKEQQKQIKAFMKAGKVAEAQNVILTSLAETTKGAAKASAGPYRDSLNTLADVTEDAQRALGEGFLPIIMEVRDILQGELAKPSTLQNIRDFGKGLAGGLSSLVGIAKNLPWGAIGDSLRIAGAGAKAVLDAFVGLPPWIQTAVLTGWGLNKLSGGALGSIVGTLASGLVKGVLGMTAGVVNINAGVVNGGGGPSGLLPKIAGAAAGAGGIGGGAAAALTLGPIAAGVGLGLATSEAVKGLGVAGGENHRRMVEEKQTGVIKQTGDHTFDAIEKQRATAMAVGDKSVSAAERTRSAAQLAGTTVASATHSGSAQIVAAIRSIPAPTISATTVNRTTTVINRTGPRSGSRVVDDGVRER